jgi:hypothetical protein
VLAEAAGTLSVTPIVVAVIDEFVTADEVDFDHPDSSKKLNCPVVSSKTVPASRS